MVTSVVMVLLGRSGNSGMAVERTTQDSTSNEKDGGSATTPSERVSCIGLGSLSTLSPRQPVGPFCQLLLCRILVLS